MFITPPLKASNRLTMLLFGIVVIHFVSSCRPLPQTQQKPLPPQMPEIASETEQRPAQPAPTPTPPSPPPTIDYRDHTFSTDIKAVRLAPLGEPLLLPKISLGTPATLELQFDDLKGNVKPYRFTLIHCNRDWTPSGLEPFQFLNGFEQVDINDYAFSSLSKQRYIHYRAAVPGPNQEFKRSGNYLLIVFNDEQPEIPVFTRRFYVAENLVNIESEVVRPPGTRERNTQQQIRLRVKTPNLQVSNPYEQLGVSVLQNGRWDNALVEIQPQFIRNAELIYERPEQLFEAGKEWRFFSLRSIRLLTERVEAISGRDSQPRARLFPDEVRVYQTYQYRADMNGQYFVAVDESDRDELEAEFVQVDFFLPFPAPLPDGSLYLFGSLTEYRFDPEFEMIYDFDRKGYAIQQLVKQGYYNYQYAYVENGSTKADFSAVEGDWFETENEYQILVYFREFDGNYDRLVGFSSASSVNRN